MLCGMIVDKGTWINIVISSRTIVVHQGKMSSIRVSLNFIRMMSLYKGIIVKLHEMNWSTKIIKELMSADAEDFF